MARAPRLFLLPGMDGGSALSSPFRRHLPKELDAVAMDYPPNERLGYAALEERVRARLEGFDRPVALLAESFSSPLAIRIAAAPPAYLAAVVLVSGFACPPVPSWLRHLTGAYAFRRPPPRALVRRFMLDRHAPAALVEDVLAALRPVQPEVMAHRAHQILTTDVRDELARASLPMLALRGSRDRIVRPRRSVTAYRPGLREVVFDAPHLILESIPVAAADAVVSFVSHLHASGS